MPAPRVLFVKLSSLGDVIHHFPAVSDLRAHRPEVVIEWAVEEAYAPLVGLHPAVSRVIPVGLRRLRSSPLAPAAWGAIAGARRALREASYDWIVDTQGLVKSAAVARLARGPVFGYDRRSIRERAAARWYDQVLAVPKKLHAVDRNRRLAGAVFGYSPEGPPRLRVVGAGRGAGLGTERRLRRGASCLEQALTSAGRTIAGRRSRNA